MDAAAQAVPWSVRPLTGPRVNIHADDSLMNNIEYGNLKVDTVLAVHGQQPVPLAEVVAAIERQVRNTQAFCRRGADAQFFQPGWPVHYSRRLQASSN